MPTELPPSAPTQDQDWDVRPHERWGAAGHGGAGQGGHGESGKGCSAWLGARSQPPPSFPWVCILRRHLLHLLRGNFHL